MFDTSEDPSEDLNDLLCFMFLRCSFYQLIDSWLALTIFVIQTDKRTGASVMIFIKNSHFFIINYIVKTAVQFAIDKFIRKKPY